MKAIILNDFGGVEQLVYKTVEKPIIEPQEVLIKVKAISINPVDVKVRARLAPLAEQLLDQQPLILGWDIAGEVVEVGGDVTDFSIGDQVFGMVNFPKHGAGYAQYVAAPSEHLAHKPKNITYGQAAASALAALTAWQAFTKYGKLRPNDRLIIHAAAGGVGHFAIQIAKHLGAYVIACSSLKNKDFVLSLGANQYLDYQNTDFEAVLTDIDFVLESIGGDNTIKSINVLKPFGTLVKLPSGETNKELEIALEKSLHACFFMSVYADKHDINQIADLLAKGIIKPHVDQTFGFDQIRQAHLAIETGRTKGKIIIEID